MSWTQCAKRHCDVLGAEGHCSHGDAADFGFGANMEAGKRRTKIGTTLWMAPVSVLQRVEQKLHG